MFVYRPHIFGRERITTPDIAIAIAIDAGVWHAPRAGALTPAWVVVAAGYGPLLTVGFLLNGQPWNLSRAAWRLAELDGARIRASCDGASALVEVTALPSPDRGRVAFVPIPGAASVDAARSGTYRIQLHDGSLDRRIDHAITIASNPETGS